jgi:polysaccharide pyruvyl transferase WcaK-like protein
MLRQVPLLSAGVNFVRGIAEGAKALLREIASLPNSWRALDGVELVVIAGSNQLLDQFGGAWGFPYTLLRWTVLARLRGARVVLLSVGAGPLDGSLACQFIRWTLRLAQYASVRDEGSAALVSRIGWAKPLPVKPDLAFSFAADRALAPVQAPANAGSLVVAVNLMPVHDPRWWPGAKPQVQASYLAAMRAFVARLLAQGHGVELYGTQPADEWVARDLMTQLAGVDGSAHLTLTRIRSLDELTVLYQRCNVIVATRFHGILLALRFARPVIGVCYYRKSRELMRDFDLEEFAFDLDRVTCDELDAAFARIIAERQRVEATATRVAAARAETLAEQYRRVLLPAEDKALRNENDASQYRDAGI